jgi:ABC-type uncharacterized transport system substrate-binding protein
LALAGDDEEFSRYQSCRTRLSAHPGGNATGLSNQMVDTGGKKLELLREVVPGLSRLAVMGNVGNPLDQRF